MLAGTNMKVGSLTQQRSDNGESSWDQGDILIVPGFWQDYIFFESVMNTP